MPNHAPTGPGTPRVRPEDVLGWTPAEADEQLERLEATVPQRRSFVDLPATGSQELVVFGDSHGDWRSTADPIAAFLEAPSERWLVGLGDYVDRAPSDCGAGSVATAVELLDLAARFPDRVYLVAGNHELAGKIATLPHDLPEEVDGLWGPDEERYHRLLGLLERGPLAIRTPGGAFLAHAGFPRDAGGSWKEKLDHPDEQTLIDLTWSDVAGSGYERGVGRPIDEAELRRFLAAAQCQIFLRGHDPPLTGRPWFHRTLLTLHTTRLYERFGGVVYATLPAAAPVRSTDDVTVHHTASEGREFPEP